MLANKQTKVSQLAVTTLHAFGIGCFLILAGKVNYKCKLIRDPFTHWQREVINTCQLHCVEKFYMIVLIAKAIFKKINKQNLSAFCLSFRVVYALFIQES